MEHIKEIIVSNYQHKDEKKLSTIEKIVKHRGIKGKVTTFA